MNATEAGDRYRASICVNDRCAEPVDSAGDACPEHECDRCDGTGRICRAGTWFKCPECHESCPDCGRVLSLGGPARIQPPTARNVRDLDADRPGAR